MNAKIFAMAAAAAVTIAACGGTSEPPTPKQVVANVSCYGYKAERPASLALEEAKCWTGSNVELDVATFVSNEQRDQWVKFAYVMAPAVLVGDRWAITMMNGGDFRQIAKLTGGVLATP